MDIKFKTKDGTIINITDAYVRYKRVGDEKSTTIIHSDITHFTYENYDEIILYDNDDVLFSFKVDNNNRFRLAKFLNVFKDKDKTESKKIIPDKSINKTVTKEPKPSNNSEKVVIKKQSKVKTTLVSLVILFILFSIGKLFFGGDNSYANLPPQERVEKLLDAGSIELGVVEYDEDTIFATASFQVLSKGIYESNVKISNMIENLKKAEDLPYNEFTISMYGKYTNSYGEEIDLKLVEASFTRATIDRIQTDYFYGSKVPDVADSYDIWNNPDNETDF